MDSHAHRPDDSAHRPHSALRHLFLQRGRRAVAQSRVAVAGGAGFFLCPSGGLWPQAPETCSVDYSDRRAGDRNFRHRRSGASAAAHPDSERRRDFHPDAISAAALHLHDGKRRDDGDRDRSLSRERNPVAADPDVRAVGQFSRRLHCWTGRDGYRGCSHVRPGLAWRRGPHEVGMAARIDDSRMRGGHNRESFRLRLVVWSGAFRRRPTDPEGDSRLGAAADYDPIGVANFSDGVARVYSAAADLRRFCRGGCSQPPTSATRPCLRSQRFLSAPPSMPHAT